MSFQVSASFVQQYTTAVQAQLQQKGSKLREACRQGQHYGKNAVIVEQIGPVVAQELTTRHADTPLISTPHDKRWVAPRDFAWADLIDTEDKLKQLTDFQSPYAQNGANAIRRAMDDRIISALYSVAKTGEDGTTNSGTPVVMGAAALTTARLTEARRRLLANEVDEDDQFIFVLDAVRIEALLNDAQVRSADFNTVRALVRGELDTWLGFRFIRSQRLPASGANLRCFAFVTSGMHFGVWNDLEISVERRWDKNGAWQVLVKGSFNGARLEEGKVIEVICT